MITPKQAGYSMPAEWYPHAGCWMAWPCRKETWPYIGLDRARLAYAQVANAISEFEPLTMIVNPADEVSAKRLCNEQINYYPQPLNDSWLRDTGPTFLLNGEKELAGVDWTHNAWGEAFSDYELDDQIAKKILAKTQARYFKAPLVMEGGSFNTDGEGTVLTSRECLLNPNRNPNLKQAEIENYLNEYLGTRKVIWLNKGLIDDMTSGHIDEIACFVGLGKVLCLTTSDQNDANYPNMKENRNLLKSVTDAKERKLELISVEQPPATYRKNERLTLSYINFYLANQGIVMPAFGHTKADDAAYHLFCALFPDRKIIQIEVIDIFTGGGGIHCITQQQPLNLF